MPHAHSSLSSALLLIWSTPCSGAVDRYTHQQSCIFPSRKCKFYSEKGISFYHGLPLGLADERGSEMKQLLSTVLKAEKLCWVSKYGFDRGDSGQTLEFVALNWAGVSAYLLGDGGF